MRAPRCPRACWLTLLLAAGFPTACDYDSNPMSEESPKNPLLLEEPVFSPTKAPLTVMSRNVFHGGDIDLVLAVGFSDPFALMDAANQVWAQVLNNDFAERAVALVDEIEKTKPAFVGLQEVVRFEYIDGTVPETYAIDLIDVLQAEIDLRGLPYSFEASQLNTVVTVPLKGVLDGSTFIPWAAVTLIERDAVLVHDDIDVTGTQQDNFAAMQDLGGILQMKRGWIRVDADVDGVPYHFVDVHMEISSFRAAQEAQTEELLDDVVHGLDGITLMVGDFNSPAGLLPGEGGYTSTYDDVLAAGFTDLWSMDNPGRSNPGYTCCHDSDLRDPADGMEKRIDFIFMRAEDPSSFKGHFNGAVETGVLGVKVSEMTSPSGMWPSDHAGVWASLWWAPGRYTKLK